MDKIGNTNDVHTYSNNYDAIIIGGGIGGLLTANILAYNGYNTVIIERNYRVGGYVVNFERGDFRFDTCIHFINGCNPGGMTHMVLDLFEGGEIVEWIPLNEILHWIDEENNLDLHIPVKIDEAVEYLVLNFPHEESGIRKFYKNYSKVFSWLIGWFTKNTAQKIWSTISELPTFLRFISKVSKPISGIIDSYIKDPALKELMTAFCISFGLFRDEMSALTWLMSEMSYKLQGAFYPKGGAGALTQGLARKFEEHGGEIILNTELIRVNFENGRAKSVICKNSSLEKKEIMGKIIINATDINNFVQNLCSPNIFSQKFIRSIQNRNTSNSSVVAYIGLDFDLREHGITDYEIWRFNQKFATKKHLHSINESMDYSKLPIEMVTIYSNLDPTCCPRGKSLVSFIYYALTDEWESLLEDGKRREKYNAFKKKVSKQLTDLLSNLIDIPDLESKIEVLELATPLTLRRYSGSKNGSHMGFKMTPQNSMMNPVKNQSPIDNLIFTGQWIMPGAGVSAVMLGGMAAANLAMKKLKK